MENSRTKNSTYSMLACMIYYIVNILFGLLNRRMLISILGIDYQGVNGLFGSVLNLLSIAELGIGTAIIYHLYKPLAEHDKEKIGSIMQFYKKCYTGIAVVMFVVGSLLSIRIDFFVNECSLPLNLHIVYFLMLADSIATYTFAYKRSILYADQKNYVVAIINTSFVLLYNIAQIAILYITNDYYYYLTVKLLFRVIENVSINIYVNKKYRYLSAKTYPPISKEVLADIILKIKGLLFHKISTFIVNGTDNILISKFLGLSLVGIYSNYYYVISSLNAILQQAFDGITGSVGNLIATSERTKRLSVFGELNSINTLLSALFVNVLLVSINPFVSLVFGSEYLLDNVTLIVLAINMVFTNQRRVFGVFKSAAGIQYEDRYVPVVESIVNIGMSLILLHFFGIVGVFLGTLISQLCDFSYTFPVFVYGKVLGGSFGEYIKCISFNLSYHTITIAITIFIFSLNNCTNFGTFVATVLFTIIQTILLFWCFWQRTPYCIAVVNRIKTVLHKKTDR